ncbi:MAG TPA: MarR family transcriptional regulator [Rhodoblastus sp.]|nr:MarR family transcriptional regulator [Rhodoblastus sp.]
MTEVAALRKSRRTAAIHEATPATPEELRRYIPYLVNRLSNRISIDQNRFLATMGLGNAALRTLSVLHIYGRLTVNEISVLAVIEQSSASRTVDQMLETGLVTRELGAQDQRRREVALTKDGATLLKKIWPQIARRAENLMDGISRADIELCADVLARMIDNVRQHDF